MTSSVFAVCLIWLFGGQMAQTTGPKSSSIHQDSDFVSVRAGDDVTLPCFYKGEIAAKLYWYKQLLGQKPQLISTYYLYEKKATFYNDFKNSSRFTLDTENGKNDLTIADLHISDSATYYCMRCYLNMLEISETITVGVTGSAWVHQSASEIIQPGGSVTLNCTVHTGTCDGEHSVYWFKHSHESQPGLIYIDGGRNDQCERKDNTQTHTCVYNLPMKSLNRSHAGTYYCAVATCGHVLFGDGTKLNTNDEDAFGYFWRGASAFFGILAVLLAFSVCMMNRGNGCKTSGSRLGCSAPSKASAEGDQNANNLYYAALSVNLTKRSRRQRDQTWSECMYLSVKQ